MTNAKMALLFSLFALAACKGDEDDVSSDSVPVDDSGPTEVVDNDGDGVPAEEDCDDDNAAVNPSAQELCDGLDNNCDGGVDEGVGTAWYTDADTDGYGDTTTETIACEPPEGAVDVAGDCDDADAAYNPGAAETDCADPNDYNCDGSVGYNDGDGDGFAACEECDDGDVSVNPNAEEICDERDNNCDGATDEGVTSTFYQDRDADGYGDDDFPAEACAAPEGYTTVGADCDDDDVGVNPAAQEVCSGIDEDCDGLIDDADDSLDTSTAITTYSDSDGDGYGDPDGGALACEAPSGNVTNREDCDDGAASVSPAGTELCDGLDNNCDGATDEATAADAATWYDDADGDGYGDLSATSVACEQPSGSVSDATDCNDANKAVNPAASEVCDSADNNCDGVTDTDAIDLKTYYADADSDGYGDISVTSKACSRPTGYIGNNKDCDDTDKTTYSGATELCDDTDNDCDGDVDDGVLGSDVACAATTCLDILNDQPSATDGVYTIEPVSGTVFDVYCDMTTDGGGWTLGFVKNSVDYDSYSDAGSTYEDTSHLQTDPATASSSSTAYGGWLNINEFTFTDLRIASYLNGAQTYVSNDISASELRIDFGQNGYLLYNDSNGYYWCAGAASYTDSGSGQVNQPSGAPNDCKAHGSLGSGWDFSASTGANAGLTMCGVDASSRWMHSGYGTSAWVTYPAKSAAQALWLR
ncbi:MAG: hypothetical protein IPO67_11695 [Deltaproteobacteria bacterium]|nr:hypothetical protein [Deltaproteobacteria bacterium]